MIRIVWFLLLCMKILYSFPIKIQSSQSKIIPLKITHKSGLNRFKDYNGRQIRNYKYAGKTIPIKDIAPLLKMKYKKPIKFNKFGYPDFTKYSKQNIVTTKLTGNHQKDIRIVEKILKKRNLNWKRRVGYTWHHHQNAKTMQYVPTDLHSAIPHSGGASRLRSIKN